MHPLRKPREMLADIEPGTEVAIGWNSPRIPTGASGFMSNMSRWLGPPNRLIRITDRIRPERPGELAVCASA